MQAKPRLMLRFNGLRFSGLRFNGLRMGMAL